MRTTSLVVVSRENTTCLPSGEIANPLTSFAEKCVHWRGGAGLPPDGLSGWSQRLMTPFLCIAKTMVRLSGIQSSPLCSS
jgi:hypothetical protein